MRGGGLFSFSFFRFSFYCCSMLTFIFVSVFFSLSLRYVPVPVQQPVAVAAPGSFYAAPSAYGSGVYRSGSFYQAQPYPAYSAGYTSSPVAPVSAVSAYPSYSYGTGF
eukprot:TRINITY_DN15_c2_g1_i2.p1 TRINITY_DN15_c2_g1~~TRINITY_DN15_c2_g1_i2.p1  ORF type:complete len:108 (-),score=21.34 TRINITY_DN15_c2_g1_i2:34-357(-)